MRERDRRKLEVAIVEQVFAENPDLRLAADAKADAHIQRFVAPGRENCDVARCQPPLGPLGICNIHEGIPLEELPALRERRVNE